MGLKDYIPGEMVVVVGAIIIDNWVKLTVAKVDETWSFTSGSGGEATRTLNGSKLVKYTLELPQTNEGNLSLYELTKTDRKATTNIAIVDPNGASSYACSRATIIKPPDAEFSQTEAGTRTWELIGPEDINITGGN